MNSGSEAQAIPFSIGSFSISGSPSFPALVFDDGAAVPLASVLPLAGKKGIRLTGTDSVHGLLADWDWNFACLSELVRCLAEDDDARGHRGGFMPEEFLKAGKLLTGPRQVFRRSSTDGRVSSLPHVVIGQPADPFFMPEDMRDSRPVFSLALLVGRMMRNVGETEAMGGIAGYCLATEIASENADETFDRLGIPGTLPLGPLLVPRAFVSDAASLEYQLGLNGPPLERGRLGDLVQGIPAFVAALSRRTLLLPGDVLVLGGRSDLTRQPLQDGDIVEAVATGLGRQMINIQCKEG